MDLFEKIGKKFGLVKEQKEKSRTEQINEQRQDIKLNIAVKLYKKGCSDEEIERVLNIIQSAEVEIQMIKNSLVGTNINFEGDPMKPLNDGIEKIRERQKQLQIDLQNEINDILKNK